MNPPPLTLFNLIKDTVLYAGSLLDELADVVTAPKEALAELLPTVTV
jgi:hypothetical protein